MDMDKDDILSNLKRCLVDTWSCDMEIENNLRKIIPVMFETPRKIVCAVPFDAFND
jgi:hypothetical protein